MQELIGEAFRLVGWGALRLVTLGRYRSDPKDPLFEGAIGLLVMIGASYLCYVVAAS